MMPVGVKGSLLPGPWREKYIFEGNISNDNPVFDYVGALRYGKRIVPWHDGPNLPASEIPVNLEAPWETRQLNLCFRDFICK